MRPNTMKLGGRPWLYLALFLGATVAHADPPPSPSSSSPKPTPAPDVSRCAVTVPTGSFVATFDYRTMTGTVTADGALGTRRFKVKSTPYSGTYMLMFQGYGAGDQKPASESMKAGTSIVARLVAYGDVTHLFLDSDYHPSVQAPMDGFICH